MKTATVTFYGGVNEIGGNRILLEDGDATILLDFGMSFGLRNQYYSVPFLSPRTERELLEFRILPDLEGPQTARVDAKSDRRLLGKI